MPVAFYITYYAGLLAHGVGLHTLPGLIHYLMSLPPGTIL